MKPIREKRISTIDNQTDYLRRKQLLCFYVICIKLRKTHVKTTLKTSNKQINRVSYIDLFIIVAKKKTRLYNLM